MRQHAVETHADAADHARGLHDFVIQRLRPVVPGPGRARAAVGPQAERDRGWYAGSLPSSSASTRSSTSFFTADLWATVGRTGQFSRLLSASRSILHPRPVGEVAHVQAHQRGDAQFEHFAGEVELPLKLRGIHDQHDRVGRLSVGVAPAEDRVHGDPLVVPQRRERGRPGQVDQLRLAPRRE